MTAYADFDAIPRLKYGLIMADPPWTFRTYGVSKGRKGAVGQYDLMTLDDIKALPVSHLAGRDCVLWLWATAPMLPQALDVMNAWGFEFKSMGCWNKRTVNGKFRWGTGYVLRSCHEPFLIGTIGTPCTPRNIPSAFDGLAREHSRKPEYAYELAERMMPDAWRLELFSRRTRPNWDGFGNEIGKYDGEV